MSANAYVRSRLTSYSGTDLLAKLRQSLGYMKFRFALEWDTLDSFEAPFNLWYKYITTHFTIHRIVTPRLLPIAYPLLWGTRRIEVHSAKEWHRIMTAGTNESVILRTRAPECELYAKL